MRSLQCVGTCRSGRRCSITAASNLLDSATGRLAAAPLKAGGAYCLFHATLFVAEPVRMDDGVVFYVDLETTGLSILDDGIVEMAAVEMVTGAAFATVVRSTCSSTAAVHGIEQSEIDQGPPFEIAFRRMVHFIENIAATALLEDSDSSCDELPTTRLRHAVPDVVVAAHNGAKFDFPFLVRECVRHGVSLHDMERWRYVDTLAAVRAIDTEIFGGCLKLQCLRHRARSSEGPNAHRALDDCLLLRDVVGHMSAALGITSFALLEPFLIRLDVSATAANLSALVDA